MPTCSLTCCAPCLLARLPCCRLLSLLALLQHALRRQRDAATRHAATQRRAATRTRRNVAARRGCATHQQRHQHANAWPPAHRQAGSAARPSHACLNERNRITPSSACQVRATTRRLRTRAACSCATVARARCSSPCHWRALAEAALLRAFLQHCHTVAAALQCLPCTAAPVLRSHHRPCNDALASPPPSPPSQAPKWCAWLLTSQGASAWQSGQHCCR